jgi:hypothetical protein
MFKNTVCILAIFLLLPSFRLNADQIKPKSRTFAGLTDRERDVIKKEVVNTTLQNELRSSRYRIFGIQSTPVKTSEGTRRYVYTLLYDYTHNKTYNVVFDATDRVPGEVC